VNFDNEVRVGTCRDVQTVDVLRDEGVELARALKGDEGMVRPVGLDLDVSAQEQSMPRRLADFG